MTNLKLKFKTREVKWPTINLIEIEAKLNFGITVRCGKEDFLDCEDAMKKTALDDFKGKLYGQIIRAIDKAEWETQVHRFDYSLSAEDRIKTAFQELRSSIPQITYD